MDTDTTAIAARAHEFITEVARILTDEPEFAAVRIADLFAQRGPQLDADAEALRNR